MKNQLFVNSLIALLFAGSVQANYDNQDLAIDDIFNNDDSALIATKELYNKEELAENPQKTTLYELEARSIECQDALQALSQNAEMENLANFKSSVEITDSSFEATRIKTLTNGSEQRSHIKLFKSVIEPEKNEQNTLYSGQIALEDTTLHLAHRAQVNPAPIAQQAKKVIVQPKLTIIKNNTPKLSPVIVNPRLVPVNPAPTKPNITPTPVLIPETKPTLTPIKPILVAKPTLTPVKPVLTPAKPILTPTQPAPQVQPEENIVTRAAKEAARRIAHNSSRAANFVKDQVINHPVRTGVAVAVATLAVADWFYGGTLSQSALEYAQSFFSNDNDQGMSPADNLDECEAPGMSTGYCTVTSNTRDLFSIECTVSDDAYQNGQIVDSTKLPIYFAENVDNSGLNIENPTEGNFSIIG